MEGKRLVPVPAARTAPITVILLIAMAVLTATMLLTLIGGRAAAQPVTTEPDPGRDDRIQILGVDETGDDIVLEVAVLPSIGRLAPVAANFGVTDGGRRVAFDVAPVDTPADTIMVLDTSGSMRGSALAAAKAAARAFVEALPDDARVGLISFDDTVVTHRSPTLDRAAILADLEGLAASGDETALWDALVGAADMVNSSSAGRSSVVILSDGDNTAGTADPAEVVRRLGTGSTVLYAVAIESPDTDLVALEEIVERVGGQFLATTDIGQLDSLYTDIAGRLANRYRLRFAPVQEGTRTVIVSVDADGSVATARTTIGAGIGTGGGFGGGEVAPIPAGPTGVPAPMLNIDDQPVLGAVMAPSPGRLGGPMMFWIGLGSMFGAFALGGLLVTRQPVQVRLDAAAGADRLGGINARLGMAADRLISRHDRGSRIDGRLESADINLRPGEFVMAWLLATVAAGLVFWALAGVAVGFLIVLGSPAASLAVLGIRAERRRSRFAGQLTETLGIMASSLRAGQSLPRAIELVAAEAPSPTAEQFHRIFFELRVGRDLTESIRDAAGRMASPDLEWLAQAIDINRELGGDLTEILDNVAATIRERRTVARQIDALSAEGRTSGWVLLAMPVGVFLFSWWRTPSSIEAFITEPMGRLLLGVALAGMLCGHVWIRRLVRVKY